MQIALVPQGFGSHKSSEISEQICLDPTSVWILGYITDFLGCLKRHSHKPEIDSFYCLTQIVVK